ncbi:hypothetical protein B0J15DRAFT_5515 [Fusarium solani]|uniref:Uncharacterized protein n=1 Tax=Fusarium solani TaxID=169388 RepID=A0A9P9L722_FUSSL|nr:uncharacterized protein B0J15DRAFT_5515 [Fusarium solani]KAH7275201.1 hypothetical protein B0J15DRAFT_5515 [Fusarium solani]
MILGGMLFCCCAFLPVKTSLSVRRSVDSFSFTCQCLTVCPPLSWWPHLPSLAYWNDMLTIVIPLVYHSLVTGLAARLCLSPQGEEGEREGQGAFPLRWGHADLSPPIRDKRGHRRRPETASSFLTTLIISSIIRPLSLFGFNPTLVQTNVLAQVTHF